MAPSRSASLGPFHLVLVKILHQPQYLDELAPSRGPHPSFYEPPQPMNAIRKSPIVQRRRLIERLGLLFEQRQIMQRIVNEIGRLVTARAHGDRFIPADDLNPVDISLRQNLLVAIACRHRVIIVLCSARATKMRPGR